MEIEEILHGPVLLFKGFPSRSSDCDLLISSECVEYMLQEFLTFREQNGPHHGRKRLLGDLNKLKTHHKIGLISLIKI